MKNCKISRCLPTCTEYAVDCSRTMNARAQNAGNTLGPEHNMPFLFKQKFYLLQCENQNTCDWLAGPCFTS